MPDNSFPNIVIAQSPFTIAVLGSQNLFTVAFSTATNGFVIYDSVDADNFLQVVASATPGVSNWSFQTNVLTITDKTGNGGFNIVQNFNGTGVSQFQDIAGNPIFDGAHLFYDVNGVKILDMQQGAIAAPSLAAPSANETALLNALNAALAALRAHGLIAT
jgi:hypothetical protein